MTLPKAYDGCTCICHRQAGVKHFFACCGVYSPVAKVRQKLLAQWDRSPKGGDHEGGSIEDESLVPEGNAP